MSRLDDEVNMGHLETVRDLLASGADVNGRNSVGDTPLFAAAHTGQPGMVRLLLSAGADLSAWGFLGKTAREEAKELGFDEVLAAMDAPGAGVSTPPALRLTA